MQLGKDGTGEPEIWMATLMYTTGRKVQRHVKCARLVIGISLYARNSLLDLKLCRDGDCNFAGALERVLPPRITHVENRNPRNSSVVLQGIFSSKKMLSLRR
jgi:hypothetical protein